jgi:hypothetical protein
MKSIIFLFLLTFCLQAQIDWSTQVKNKPICLSASGSTTVYTCPIVISSCSVGLQIFWTPDETSGVTPTLNVGCGAKPIKTNENATPPLGLFNAGYPVQLWFDGTSFRAPASVPTTTGQQATGSVMIPTTLPESLPTTTGPSGVLVPVLISSGAGPISPTATGFYFNNHGALTYNLPTITSASIGLQMCFRNDTGISGALTIVAPASTTIDVAGAVKSTPGNLSSAGALGDAACVVAVGTTLYMAYTGPGTWSNN